MTLNVKVRNRISFYINYLHKLKIYGVDKSGLIIILSDSIVNK